MNLPYLLASTLVISTISFSNVSNASDKEFYNPGFNRVLFKERDLSNDRSNPTHLGKLRYGKNTIDVEFSKDDFDYFSFKVPRWLVLDKVYLVNWETRPCFEDVGFFAMVKGETFDYEFPNPNNPEAPAEGLLGWTHLRSTQAGSDVGICGGDVLCEMGLANMSPVDAGLAETFELEAGINGGENPYDSINDQAICDDFTPEELQARLVNLTNTWAPGAQGFSGPLDPGTYSFWLRQGSDTRVKATLVFVTKSRYQ